ncbi:MAG: carbohydrate ABC transporter permease [Lachnospiraceae bacterium]|nr:carbohydrate ABC transporter permease [Lachnospiraceae bacterium]
MAQNSSSDNGNLEIYKVKKTSKVAKVLIYIGLIIWLIIDLFPIYYMLTFSLKDNDEIFGANVLGLPKHWLFSNYVAAMGRGNMPRNFLNSIIVSGATIVITLIAALMATYALTRIPWKGSKLMNSVFMLGITIPIHVALYPVYSIFIKTGILVNFPYASLIIPYSAFGLSMAIMISTGFMNDIPKELDEAANIDGCGVWGIFFRVIVPLMKPALATMGIYTFLQCWNEFMFASIFINDSAHKTLPVGISELQGRTTTDWGIVGAGLAIATLPMLIIYVFLSKRIQESFMVGAVKG